MEFVRVGDIVKLYKGKKADVTGEMQDGYQRYIQIDDLRNDSNLKYTHTAGVEVTPDDVVIAWDGANAGTVGYGLQGVIGSTLAKIKITDERVNPYFLGAILESKQAYLRSRATGATIPHLSKIALFDIKVPLMDDETQNHIVASLSTAKSLCQKRRTAMTLLDDYLFSSFMNLFDQDDEYAKVKLVSLVADGKSSLRTGPFGSDLKHSEFTNSGVAVLGIDNAVKNHFQWDKKRYITPEKYQKLKRYTVFPRDVIVTIMGTTGRSAVIPEDIPLAINTKHLAAITFDARKANPYFMSYSLQADPRIKRQIARQSKGAIMDGLNLTIIKNLEFAAWPIEQQNKFEEIYHEVQTLKAKMAEQLSQLETQQQSLSHSLLLV